MLLPLPGNACDSRPSCPRSESVDLTPRLLSVLIPMALCPSLLLTLTTKAAPGQSQAKTQSQGPIAGPWWLSLGFKATPGSLTFFRDREYVELYPPSPSACPGYFCVGLTLPWLIFPFLQAPAAHAALVGAGWTRTARRGQCFLPVALASRLSAS